MPEPQIDFLEAEIKDFIDAFDLLPADAWATEHFRILECLTVAGFVVRRVEQFCGGAAMWQVILRRTCGPTLASALAVGADVRRVLRSAGINVNRDTFRLMPSRQIMIAQFVYKAGEPGYIRIPRPGKMESHRYHDE